MQQVHRPLESIERLRLKKNTIRENDLKNAFSTQYKRVKMISFSIPFGLIEIVRQKGKNKPDRTVLEGLF